MKILVTEAQYKNLISEMGREGGAHLKKRI
jgi:hypothetical protein